MNIDNVTRSPLRGLILLLALAALPPAPASAAHSDVAPLPDDVVARLTAPVKAERDRDVTAARASLAALLEAIDALERDSSTEPSTPADRAVVRAQRLQLGRTRTELLSRGLPELPRAVLAARFRRLDGLLSAVEAAGDAAERRRAIARLRQVLERWLEAGRDVPAEAVPANPTFRPLDPLIAPRPPRASALPAHAAYPADEHGVLLASLGHVALAPPPVPAEATSCGFQPTDLARTQEEVDFVKHAALRALAEKLGYEPARIYEHVANTIRYEPYFGSVKGAIGALETGAGNAHDQASLLIALLRASSIPARYVFGLAEVADPIPMGQEGRLARWLGVKDYPAVEAVMRASGLLSEAVQDASGATVGMRFIHVWVEACLPYGSYRGARIDASGHRWIPLDPSFKDSTYQPGIQHAATFDLAGYLTKRTNGPDSLPHEAYSERVETAIRTLPPRYANNSLLEVPYSGKIFERRFDVLPVTLPYRVVGFYQFDPPANPTAEAAALPETHRVKLKVRVRKPDGTVLLEHRLRMVEVTRARLTLAFEGLSTADRDTIDGWRAGESLAASAEPACSVQVTPALRVEGVEVKAGTLGTDFCSTTLKLDLELDVDALSCSDAAGNPLSGCLNRTAFSNIEAGNLYALLAYGYHTSNALIEARAARLIAAVRATANPNDDLESTEGEFLHLVGLKYLRYLSDAAVRSAELTGSLGRNGMHLGVTTARSKIAYVFDLPFALSRTGFLIDVPGGRFSPVDLATGASKWDAFVLASRSGSAYESYVWQENAKLDAVSTMRGLQFAKETGVGLLTVTKANWSTQKPKLAAAYPSLLAELDRMVNQDLATLTIPTKAITYDNWNGVVYMAESQSKGYGTYAINGGYSGGYTTNPISWSYSPLLDSGYNFVAPPPAPSFTSIVNFAAPPPVVNSAINFGASPYSTYSGDPVNMVTGNMYHGETDLSIPGRGGMSIVLQRSYNSRKPQDGPFGFGWTHSFNHYLEFRTDDYDITPGEAVDKDNLTSAVVWVDGSGAEKYIAVTGVLATAAGVPHTTTLVSPAGYFFTADKLPDGSWTIKERNGLTYTFEIAAGTVGQRARLVKIADRNGNALMLEYDAGGNLARVKDSLDRALEFDYEPGSSRIRQVSDWTGRRWQYAYDAAGNLVSYWKPGLERTATPSVAYAYLTAADGENLDHAMSRYTFARGNGMHFEYYANGRVFRHRTTLGETMSFSYNDFRRETIQINERGHERRFFFNKDGMLVKLVEENAATREFAYGTGKLLFSLSKSTDPRGNVTAQTYTATTGDLGTTTLPSGLTHTRTQYNAFGAPGKIKDARNLYTVYKYDARGNLLHEIKLKAGIGADVTANSYAPVASQIAAWTVFTYDVHGNLLTSRRVRDIAKQISAPATVTGPTLEYTYDADKLYPTGITRKGDKDGNAVVDALDMPDTAVLVHDALGRLRQGIDGRWEITRFEYDDADRLSSAQDATGNVRRYAYDANGNLESEKLFGTADGGETIVDSVRHEYDLSDRRIKTTANDGGVTRFEFDAAGNVVRTTDPDGYSTTIGYDELNRPVFAADQEGNRVSKQLDIDGRPLSVTDPNGFTVTYDYYDKTKDLRIKRVTQPRAAGFAGGRAVEYDYDANGQVTKTSVLPADGGAARISLATYNELGLPTRVVGPVVTDPVLGKIRPVTRTTYNALGHVTKIDAGRTAAVGTDTTKDVVSVQATYTWDDFGRKLKQTDAAGKFWRYEYDTAGNLRRIVDPNGHVTEQTFQPGGRLETRETKSGGTTLFAALSYERNALGQALSVTSSNPAYTQSFDYDAGHRLSRVDDSRGGKTLHYEFSPGGRLEAMRDSDGARTDYLYDAVGRLIGISAPSSDYFAFGYDRGGRLTERWAPNGVHSAYAYNDDATLASIEHAAGGEERARHAYSYDAWGNRVAGGF